MGNRKFQIPEEDFVIRKDPPKKEPEVVIEKVKEVAPDQSVFQDTASYTGGKDTAAPYTQGKKGQSLPRLHLALTPANYEFLKSISRRTGSSYSGFINALLDAIKDGKLDVTGLYNWD